MITHTLHYNTQRLERTNEPDIAVAVAVVDDGDGGEREKKVDGPYSEYRVIKKYLAVDRWIRSLHRKYSLRRNVFAAFCC